MPSCKVVGCTVGYESNPDKGPFLTVPKALNELEQWRTATKLPNLKTGDSICHNHFRPEEVLTHKIIYGPNDIIMREPYKHVRRKPGAVPSLFPWTLGDADEEEDTPETTEKEDRQNLSASFVKVEPNSPRPTSEDEHADSEDNFEAITLEDLTNEVIIPTGWTLEYLTRSREAILVISQRNFSCIGSTMKIYAVKEIVVTEDLQLQLSILQEKIDPLKLNCNLTIRSIDILQEVLSTFEDAVICSGSHSRENNQVVDCSVVRKDAGDTWRHIACPLIIVNGKTCTFCQKVEKSGKSSGRLSKRAAARGKRKSPYGENLQKF